MDSEIYEKLSEIKDLNDRILLKKIMNNVFEALEEYSKNKLNELEERVFNELQYVKEKYNIYSSIIKRDKLDLTDEFMFPILPEDTEESIYNTKEILDSLANKQLQKMFKVFLKCDYLIFKEFINSDLNIKGIIKTNRKDHEAYFKVVRNTEYMDKIQKLYKSFISSNITWTTINNPYIHKIADVILIGCKDKIENDENVISIEVDFGEYSQYIEYDMVPLWNIKELNLKCDGFPSPCVDKVYYEHEILIFKEGPQNGYLVDDENEGMECVTYTKQAVVIESKIRNSKIWKIWSVVSKDKKKKQEYEYELMTNEVNVNFSNKLAFEKPYMIKTKTELARVIDSYKASRYLQFNDVKIVEEYPDKLKQTYEVNDFIIDEIREDNIRKSLILYFEQEDKENYLNKDILSFLVSEVQLLYPEYECEGRLI
ncbi:normocyte-binding protein [uncultured Clostridium sp.]|uniref:normocyte-binding protein n=1 Tax=uncultured Clostridium sp. TaxID=59620 RepID=UPI0028E468B5|nr:normocyte-binding protein [uncultured Clostridium sp.]